MGNPAELECVSYRGVRLVAADPGGLGMLRTTIFGERGGVGWVWVWIWVGGGDSVEKKRWGWPGAVVIVNVGQCGVSQPAEVEARAVSCRAATRTVAGASLVSRM